MALKTVLIVDKKEIYEWTMTLLDQTARRQERFIHVLNRFKNKQNSGVEGISVFFQNDFEEWDEYRCKDNEIALLTGIGEERIGYMKLPEFYKLIEQVSQEHVEWYPENKENVKHLLKEVKAAFRLD